MEQRTQDWYQARLGHVTASQMSNVLATIKSGEAASRANYRIQVITERLVGAPTEDAFVSSAMQRGIDLEPVARSVYEAYRGVDVEECGFVQHPSIKWFGASPDGLIGDDGLIEIKCPNSQQHIQYWCDQKIPGKYQAQMLAQLACTQRKWCDFVSFDNRMPEDMMLLVIRFEPAKEEIEKIESEVKRFLSEVDMQLDVINKRRNHE